MLGIALNTKRIELISFILGAVGVVILFVGGILVYLAMNRNLGSTLQPQYVERLRQNELPGILLEYVGLILMVAAGVLYVYVFIDRWRIATRRKSPGDVLKTGVWFCPYCGNLDVKGARHCPGCGKPLPRFIAIKNGAWAPADSEDPRKVAIGKEGKRV